MVPDVLDELIEFSAAPTAVRVALERLIDARPETAERLLADEALARAAVAVAGASRHLTTLLVADPGALDVLAALGERAPADVASRPALKRWKDLEHLRIAARDLLGLDDLLATVAAISAMATDVLAGSVGLVAGDVELAVIGMGKLGAGELNYASDIDVLFVGDGVPDELDRVARHVMAVARDSFRVDANLRPQGRDGPLVRSLASYAAYWERWAEPWEFQALLKARAAAGSPDLGAAFDEAAAGHLWQRSFSADDLRSVRHLKARMEAQLARKGLTDREVKRGRGGIRDIEFAVQLLQLVHGRADPELRAPATLEALAELAAAGYIDPDDAPPLREAYVFLRRLEHRLQLHDGAAVYAMPVDDATRTRLARTLGLRDTPTATAVEQLDATLGQHQATVRSIHERLYFRPLLEAFASADPDVLTRPGAVDERLAAMGFSDGLRTRAAVQALTRGLTRSSRLMQQMLPLLLGWLSASPDPDLGLLNLRNLATGARAEELARTFRESPETARRLCLVLGTSRLAGDILRSEIDLVERLPEPERLQTLARTELEARARTAVAWRDPDEQQGALRRWKERHLFGVIARDLLGEAETTQVGRDLTAIADAGMQVALDQIAPQVPFAVVALGRLGGAELSYASDLDVVFVYDGDGAEAAAEADRVATRLRRFLRGDTPSARVWDVDCDLRPEGKQGPLARSLEGFATYFDRWALVWERQAMLRARPMAGDADVGLRFMDLLDGFVWAPGLSDDDRREIRRLKARIERERIPASEDPAFHLKLGRGSLSDVEWTVQLLQLEHGLAATGTMDALGALADAGALAFGDAESLEASFRFCEATRNRLFLVRSGPGDALPNDPNLLLWLARSLDTTPSALREQYRRVTRRARAVTERLFYGRVD